MAVESVDQQRVKIRLSARAAPMPSNAAPILRTLFIQRLPPRSMICPPVQGVHSQRDTPRRTSERSILHARFRAGDVLSKSYQLGVKLRCRLLDIVVLQVTHERRRQIVGDTRLPVTMLINKDADGYI